MIKSNHIYLILICLSTCFLACEESIDLGIDSEDVDRRLVVNEFFSSGSPWSVEVTSSFFILEDDAHAEPIEDAIVKIYNEKNEFIYDLYHQGNGIYGQDDYSPDVNRRYSISVTHEDFNPVTANSYVPENSGIKINEFNTIVEDKDEGVEVDFQIENSSNVNAYYIWEIISLEYETGGDITGEVGQLSDNFIKGLKEKSGIPKNRQNVIGVGVFGDGTYSTTYSSFDDDNRWDGFGTGTANGVVPTTTVGPDLTNEEDYGDGEGDGSGAGDPSVENFKYELRVVSISEELYRYYTSIEESDSNNPPNSVGNPVELYTNVNSGLGIFAGFHESKLKF